MCFGFFDCMLTSNAAVEKKDRKHKEWQVMTHQKMDEIFRQNNSDMVPDWFYPFQNEFIKYIKKKGNDGGKDF